MRFNIYTIWIDPVFYAAAAAFAFSLFFLVYSIRRYVELKNSDEFDGLSAEEPAVPPPGTEPAIPGRSALPPSAPQSAGPEPRAAEPGRNNRAETFVKGIYDGLSTLEARLKNIEISLSRGKVNNDFTVKFLEDILSDLDALDKEKIKARIEYLLADLKK